MSVTALNGVGTLENFSLVGIFLTTGTTSAAAIPIETIGLYQLIDHLISTISTLKSTIQIAEIQLRTDLSADDLVTTMTVTAPVQIAAFEAATLAFNDRGTLTGLTNSKPSLLDDGTNFFSEDALFQTFSQFSYEIMKFRYNLATGNNNGSGAGHPGQFALPISAAAVGS